MSPEILRVGFFMGWPKEVVFLMVVFLMIPDSHHRKPNRFYMNCAIEEII